MTSCGSKLLEAVLCQQGGCSVSCAAAVVASIKRAAYRSRYTRHDTRFPLPLLVYVAQCSSPAHVSCPKCDAGNWGQQAPQLTFIQVLCAVLCCSHVACSEPVDRFCRRSSSYGYGGGYGGGYRGGVWFSPADVLWYLGNLLDMCMHVSVCVCVCVASLLLWAEPTPAPNCVQTPTT